MMNWNFKNLLSHKSFKRQIFLKWSKALLNSQFLRIKKWIPKMFAVRCFLQQLSSELSLKALHSTSFIYFTLKFHWNAIISHSREKKAETKRPKIFLFFRLQKLDCRIEEGSIHDFFLWNTQNFMNSQNSPNPQFLQIQGYLAVLSNI